MEVTIPTWQVGIDKAPQCKERQTVIPPYEQTCADEKTTAQRGQGACQIPASQWLSRSEIALLARPRSFQKLSQQLQPSVRNLFLFTESCALCGRFVLNSLLETKLFFFLNILRNISLSFIFANYNLDMKTWANLACFSIGILVWNTIGLERQIQSSYFKISACTWIHTQVSQNEVRVGGRKIERPSKSGLPWVTCLQTSAHHLPSPLEPMHAHTHGLDFSSSAWHRDLDTNILWEEMSRCRLLSSQICSTFSGFSKDSRSGRGPPGIGMSLEARLLGTGPFSTTISLCDHRSTLYPYWASFYTREGKSDILYWEEIPARTPRVHSVL